MALARSSSAALLATAILALLFLAEGYRGLVGGRKEIKDVKTNEEVQELGRFSVEEYNKSLRRGRLSNGVGELEFTEVLGAESQVVSGIKYYLKILATQKGEPKIFDSVVVVGPWLHSKRLLSFAPSSDR